MTTTTIIPSTTTFPAAEIRRRLTKEVSRIAEDLIVVKSEWEPNLDSLAIVGVLACLGDLFDSKLPPEKLIRKGGYAAIDEAVEDMTNRLYNLWQRNEE